MYHDFNLGNNNKITYGLVFLHMPSKIYVRFTYYLFKITKMFYFQEMIFAKYSDFQGFRKAVTRELLKADTKCELPSRCPEVLSKLSDWRILIVI